VQQNSLARCMRSGLYLIHLEESTTWKAEPREHLVPLRPAARVSRGGRPQFSAPPGPLVEGT
jgi:hypothetical protein